MPGRAPRETRPRPDQLGSGLDRDKAGAGREAAPQRRRRARSAASPRSPSITAGVAPERPVSLTAQPDPEELDELDEGLVVEVPLFVQ